MTREEMKKRISELGGLNPMTALIVSIEKWQSLHEHLREDGELDREHEPGTSNCALCEFYYTNGTRCCKNVNGNDCPLSKDDGYFGCGTGSLYHKATSFLREVSLGPAYRVAFLKAQAEMVKRLKEELDKLDSSSKAITQS